MPYIAFQHDDGTWHVPWDTRYNAMRHRADVEREFHITLQIRRTPDSSHGDWETTT